MNDLKFVYKHFRFVKSCFIPNTEDQWRGRHGFASHYQRGESDWTPRERGGYTLCFVYNSDGEMVSSGIAECSPLDAFNYRIGRTISRIRARAALTETGINPNIEAMLKSVSRGFGGDNAFYESPDGELVVCVGWALLCPYSTVVIIHGQKIAEYNDPRYVQPPEALRRLGYNVRGGVDFCRYTPAVS